VRTNPLGLFGFMLASLTIGVTPAGATAPSTVVAGRPAVDVAECVSTDRMYIGMPGPDSQVALLQTRLIELGFDPGEVDGYFGENTFVATYQSQAPYSDGTSGGNGIFADEGTVLGPAVFERLGIACGFAVTTAAEVEPTTPPAPAGAAVVDPTVTSTQRVRFEPGASGATVEATAAPGAGVRYLLEAAAGQWMTVSLTADAGPAVFTVFASDGRILSGPTQTWAGSLPATGDYAVDVTSPAPTGFTIVFAITSDAPAAPPATALSPLPAGATLSNPVLLQHGSESVLTDGRHELIPLPGQAARRATLEPDGTIVLLADDRVATVAAEGVVRTAGCPGCSGLAVHGDRIVLTRDPGSGAVFEFVFLNRNDLSDAGNITALRMVDPNPYPEDDRQYWDTPLVLFTDDDGIVVTYDYRPGGMNARGGDETVVARYSLAGELVASNRLAGRVDAGVVSPDRRFVALAFGGSFGACYTVRDPGVLDLVTLTLSVPPVIVGDGTTWYQLDPYWDNNGVLRAVGERFHEPSTSIDDEYCQITIEPWEQNYDTATGVWTEHATNVVTRWIGPACNDVLTLVVIQRVAEDGNAGVQVTANLDGATLDLGPSGWVQLGRAVSTDCT